MSWATWELLPKLAMGIGEAMVSFLWVVKVTMSV